jgi:hypothetical protein
LSSLSRVICVDLRGRWRGELGRLEPPVGLFPQTGDGAAQAAANLLQVSGADVVTLRNVTLIQ